MKTSVEDFIQGGPTFVRMQLAQRGARRDTNWPGIASAVVLQARAADDRNAALEWARAADQIFRALYKMEGEWAFSLKAMTLRIAMIEKWGADEKQEILNPREILEWFESTVGDENPRKIIDRASNIVNQPLHRVRHLRQIKNALGIVRDCLRLAAVSPDDPIVRDWLRVADRLP